MTRYLEIKPGSIAEAAIRLRDDYQAYFKKELEKAGKGIAQMSDAEKKAFFNRVDKAYNAKSEAAPATKPDDSKTTMVVKPGAPAGEEKVIRIPKEKLADYKSKGYVEAESYIPEAKKIDELTSGQKKLPPALQKAIKAKEKNEDIASMNPNYSPQARDYAAREKDIKPKKNEPLSQVDLFLKKMKDPKFAAAFRLSQKKENTNEAAKNPYAIGMAAAMKATGDKPPLKKSTITKAHDIADKIKKEEVKVDLPATLKSLQDRLKKLEKDPDHGGKQDMIDYVKSKIKMIQGKMNEEVEIAEGQFKDIDIRKGDLKLAKDKRQSLKDKYNAIMANQAQGDENAIADQIQKLDMSIKKQEQELIDIMKKGKQDQKNEAVDPERVQKLNQKIASMTSKIGELDKSKPENKTKEAILKSDIATAKLRLQDLMQKSASAVKKAVNEASKAKQSYKTLKMSLKKEQETDNKKKTLTDKPLTKIEVNPKIES